MPLYNRASRRTRRHERSSKPLCFCESDRNDPTFIIRAFCPISGSADYTIRYLSPILSGDEELVDASKSGWLLVRDNTDLRSCVVRVKLGSGAKVRLCDKGLIAPSQVNDRGVVLGSGDDPGKTIAMWGDEPGLKILAAPTEA